MGSKQPGLGKSTQPRLPPQIPPTLIEAEYGNALERLLAPVFAAYNGLLNMLPSILTEHARGDARMDAGQGAKVKQLIAQIAQHTQKAVRRDAIEDVARKFAARTSTYQRVQLNKQVRAALGVDPIIKDRGLAAASEQFVHENAALITRIPERLHGDVEALVQHALSSSMPSPKLAEHIQARFGVSKRHARFIARDQIRKHHAKLNHARQKELGVKKFRWTSVGDERVREWHRDELDGNIYEFDNPPDSEDGEPILPGDDYDCRCSADPIFDF